MGKREELSRESIDLIKEIICELKFYNENLICDIQSDNESKDIVLFDKSSGKVEYSLSEVSFIFTDNNEQLWGTGENLFGLLKNIEHSKKGKFKQMGRDEFIEYSGRVEYIKLKSNQIINRLREIESEA